MTYPGSPGSGFPLLRVQEHVNQLSDGMPVLERVPKVLGFIDPVSVASSHPLAVKDPAFDQVPDDDLYRPFRDADPLRHLAQGGVRIFGQAKQDEGVVVQKCPSLFHFVRLICPDEPWGPAARGMEFPWAAR